MQNDNAPETDKTKKTSTSTRVMLTIPTQLLERVDKAASEDYTSRSDVIRSALLWYLRPEGRVTDQLGPNEIYDLVKARKAKRGIKKMLRDAGMTSRSGRLIDD